MDPKLLSRNRRLSLIQDFDATTTGEQSSDDSSEGAKNNEGTITEAPSEKESKEVIIVEAVEAPVDGSVMVPEYQSDILLNRQDMIKGVVSEYQPGTPVKRQDAAKGTVS